MGDYTWFHFVAEFRVDNLAVPWIQYLVDPQSPRRERAHNAPNHALFNINNRHKHFLIYGPESQAHITGRTEFTWNSISERYELVVDTSFKHYGNEIPLFLSWLRPYDTDGVDGFRGFYLAAYNEHPGLIYRQDGQYMFRQAGLQERTLRDNDIAEIRSNGKVVSYD